MSRSVMVVRLLGMKRTPNRLWIWLAGVVIAHLAISVLHGAAHAQAHIPMSRPANAFVFVVILAGPLIGLAWTLRSRRIGAWLVGVTMAASLVFGLVNHFVLATPDHVSHVDPRWQPLFAATAVLLAITEALGSALAIRVVRERRLT
jgi:hypothetical protein